MYKVLIQSDQNMVVSKDKWKSICKSLDKLEESVVLKENTLSIRMNQETKE